MIKNTDDDVVWLIHGSHNSFVQSAQRIIMNHLEIDLMPYQLSNVV